MGVHRNVLEKCSENVDRPIAAASARDSTVWGAAISESMASSALPSAGSSSADSQDIRELGSVQRFLRRWTRHWFM